MPSPHPVLPELISVCRDEDKHDGINLKTNQSPFSLWFNRFDHLGIQIQSTHPQAHGLARFGCLLDYLRLKLWIVNILLELL